MKKNVNFFLVAVNIGLALVLAWQWVSPAGQRDTHWVAPTPIKPQLNSNPGLIARNEDASRGLAEMQQRPIFSANRRPVSAASAPAVSLSDPIDGIRLYGVFAGSDGGGVILGSEGKTRRMKLSDVIGDWRLQKVRDKEAVFARGTQTRVISLVQVKQGQTPRPTGFLPVQPTQPPFQFPNAAPLAAVPAPPAAPAPARPVASSAKPAPGFLIGGSR